MKQDVSRREFMKGAAGLAGVIAAGYSPSLYAVGANDRVRVACDGSKMASKAKKLIIIDNN